MSEVFAALVPEAAGDATVVVVDMQPAFRSSQKFETLFGVIRLLEHSRAMGWGIVILEFAGRGRTDERIMDAVRSYHRLRVVKKPLWDGSAEVLAACEQAGFSRERFVACGVNTHECVLDTVSGMSAALPECHIDVVQDACNCETGYGWLSFPKLPNLALVPCALELAYPTVQAA